MALPIPSETWGSLLEIGLTQYLAKKIRESRQGEEEEGQPLTIQEFTKTALTTGTQVQGFTSYNNIALFLTDYSATQNNYLLNASVINSFVYGDGAGGPGGEAGFSGGYGAIGTSESSPFGSVSSFGQDTADKIGAAVGGLFGLGFKAGVGFAFGMNPISSLVSGLAMNAAMPKGTWGTWGYFVETVKSLFGFESDSSTNSGYEGQVGFGQTGYGSGYGMDVGIGRDASLTGTSTDSDTSGGDTGDTGGSGHDGGSDGANE